MQVLCPVLTIRRKDEKRVVNSWTPLNGVDFTLNLKAL